MESTTCDVQQGVQQTEVMDGLPKLLPIPSSIKVQMPLLAAHLQQLAASMGRECVDLQVRASLDIRAAYDRDDFRAVSRVYARGHGWIASIEGGACLGVPDEYMRAFARRHRGR
jgi:hypothetical protein